MTQHSIQYRPDIDGLRAIAVLLVLIYHAFPQFLPSGFIGVDVFFVISGYLITQIILKDLTAHQFSIVEFYRRRIKRIFPALMAVIAVVYMWGWFAFFPRDFMELGKHVFGGTFFLANIFFWWESGYFDASAELKPLLHLWSLGIEEQYYFIWPPLLALLFTVFQNARRKIWAIVSLLALCSFFANVWYVRSYSETVFYWPVFRFWELWVGSLLALSSKKQNNPAQWEMFCSPIGLTMLAVGVLSISTEVSFPGWWALLPVGGSALLIRGNRANSWVNSTLLSSSPLVNIGLLSYSLYLWHWPILSIMRRYDWHWPLKAHIWLAVILSFAMAYLSYKFIEQPTRRSKSSLIVWASLIAAFSLGTMGAWTYYSQGFAHRFAKSDMQRPAIFNELLDPHFGQDLDQQWRTHQCFIKKEDGEKNFSSECRDSKTHPEVVIWGDSHAAALYPGLNSLKNSREISVSQFTSSHCPPILNWNSHGNPRCAALNQSVVENLRDNPFVDVVILHAQWATGGYPMNQIVGTISELRSLNIQKIILLGPAPAWKKNVPELILDHFEKFGRFPPVWTRIGLDFESNVKNADETLKKLAGSGDQVQAISLSKLLCHESEGCRLQVGDRAEDVVSYDQGHMTPAAASFIARQLPL